MTTRWCSSQLCGFLSVVLPIVGGVVGLLLLYLVIRYSNQLCRVVATLLSCFFVKPEEMSAATATTNDAEKGGGGANGVVVKETTFEPNFFFLRQNSINEATMEKSDANGDVNGAVNGAVNGGAGGPLDTKRRLSKTHPACSPTFQTDPIDWADLGITLPKKNGSVDAAK